MGYQIAAIVDWFGPYDSLGDARAAARKDYDTGLYMLIGREKSQKKTKLQYIGVAQDLAVRLSNNHKKAKELSQVIQIWLGEIASTGIPGSKQKRIDMQIDLVEWAHAFFLEIDNNEKKTANPPFKQVTVVNRWWKKDFETPYLIRPHADWPDIIDFKGTAYGCNVGWIGKRDKWKSV